VPRRYSELTGITPSTRSLRVTARGSHVPDKSLRLAVVLKPVPDDLAIQLAPWPPEPVGSRE
jgi:hypothetical protein